MQQSRRLPSTRPSALLAALALAGTACAATSVESATAPDLRAAEQIADVERVTATDTRTEVVVTAPMPETTVPATTIRPTATTTATTMPPTTAPPATAPATTTPPTDPMTTTPPATAPVTTMPPSEGDGSLVTPTVESVQPGRAVTIDPVIAVAPCAPVGPIPASAAAVMSIDLDLAGDGTADDTATSYLDGDTGDWVIRLATAGGTVSEQIVTGVAPGFVEVLGAVEFGSAGADSFLATVGSSPSSLRLGLFGADATGCLVRHGGEELTFGVGGSIAGFSGVRCGSWDGGHFVESLGAGQVGPDAYNVYGTSVHLDADGETFAESGTHLFGITADEAQQIAVIDCPGFES